MLPRKVCDINGKEIMVNCTGEKLATIDDNITELGKQLDPKWDLIHTRYNEFIVKPWGTYETLFEDYKCKVKQIVIHPGKAISLQSHEHRDETWKLIQGTGEVSCEGDVFTVDANDALSICYIKRKWKHRIRNIGNSNLVFIEIQTGDYFGEDDIVRYEDDYGRI